MKYKLKTWQNDLRKEHFNHFSNVAPCSYSMTIMLDITNLLKQQVKLYPTMIYLITKVVNQTENFKTNYNQNKELVIYDQLNPSYTIFHQDSKTFSNLWLEYKENYANFLNDYLLKQKKYENDLALFPQKDIPENIFCISMIPWQTFYSFDLNLYNGKNYLLPIFTMGKYFKQGEKTLLPLAIQVNHAVCDGYHLTCFIHELQQLINQW